MVVMAQNGHRVHRPKHAHRLALYDTTFREQLLLHILSYSSFLMLIVVQTLFQLLSNRFIYYRVSRLI